MIAIVTPATGASAATSPPRAETVTWGACPPADPALSRDPRQRCATLRVPVDYRRPHGATIDIAISRIGTAKPEKRRGILLSNPGGPGGPGLDLPSALAQLLPRRYSSSST